MKLTDMRFEGPWGHCLLLLGFIVFTVWYVSDASTASSGIRDILLIGPVGAIALLLCGGFFIKEAMQLRVRRATPADAAANDNTENFQQRYGAPTVMAALAIYVALIPFIGMDTATFLFAAVLMVIQGEKKIWVVVLFSAIVTFFVMTVMLKVLSVGPPTLFMEKILG